MEHWVHILVNLYYTINAIKIAVDNSSCLPLYYHYYYYYCSYP